MKRATIVSRTVTGTKAEVLIFDVTNQLTHRETFELKGSFENEHEILSCVSNLLDAKQRAVQVTKQEPFKKRYAMDENQFIYYAKEVPLLNQATKQHS